MRLIPCSARDQARQVQVLAVALSARPLCECLRACVCVFVCVFVRARAIVLGVEWKISTCWQRSDCSSPSALAALHWTPGGGGEGGEGREGWLWGGARAPFLTFALL